LSRGVGFELVSFVLSSMAARSGRLVAGRAGEDGGVKVERPQPKARTYDLEATVGRRTLVSDDRQVRLWDRPGAGVRIGVPSQ
jgi:hypothetical protein